MPVPSQVESFKRYNLIFALTRQTRQHAKYGSSGEVYDSKEKRVTLQCNLQHITYQLGQDEEHLCQQPLIYATLHLLQITNKNSNPIHNN